METTRDAWDRFLATCRLVHDGCRHPDLNLPAYGGRLFDATRFPAMEDPRCQVSNSTFYEVLRLLLFARRQKGGEPQRVDYWAIDVEQIGYIYEGLLDHRCARAGEVPMVKLRGAGEAAMAVTELEEKSREVLAKLVEENTKSKPEAVQKAMERETIPKDIERLNHFPAPVAERVRPFANIVRCEEVVPPFWRYLTTGTSRRASGAHYTPQSLTERIVRVTLEPLVYRNVEGKPGLLMEPKAVKSPRELLHLKVCDIAMGSGAFLVQAVRYLADRLVEAWDRALVEANDKDPAAHLTMPYAERVADAETEQLIDPEKRDEMVVWARRYVAERCIYGVDVNQLAVEMAALSLWLTTLAKDRPFTFLDHALKCGDSLVGVDQEQLQTWSLDRNGEGAPLLKRISANAINEALGLRKQLAMIAVVDATDAERKAALLEKAEQAMKRARLAGDLIIAPSFAEEKKDKKTGKVRAVEKVEHRFTISERARLEVLRRLLELNRLRHAEEVAEGLHDKKKRKAENKPERPPQKREKENPQLGFGFLSQAKKAAEEPAVYKTASAGRSLSEDATKLLTALEELGDWASKRDVLDAADLPASQWSMAIGELLDTGRAERQGEKRGAKYRKV